LWYKDSGLTKVLEAGRYKIPLRSFHFWPPKARIEVQLVDMCERDLTIKGHEILTADKVALRAGHLSERTGAYACQGTRK
jgi:hypothetical protein